MRTSAASCHDEVGRRRRQPPGRRQYTANALDQRTPDENPEHLFPLDATFSEWASDAFASGGVDYGGRFRGCRARRVSTLPGLPHAAQWGSCASSVSGGRRARTTSPGRVQVLDIIAAYTRGDPVLEPVTASPRACEGGRHKLQRAASLEPEPEQLRRSTARVTNDRGTNCRQGTSRAGRVAERRLSADLLAGTRRARAYMRSDRRAGYSSTLRVSDADGPERRRGAGTGLPAGVTGACGGWRTRSRLTTASRRGDFVNGGVRGDRAPAVGHARRRQYWDDALYDSAWADATCVCYQNTLKSTSSTCATRTRQTTGEHALQPTVVVDGQGADPHACRRRYAPHARLCRAPATSTTMAA